jgi:glutathione synthase/RimK-type ligase-like ATP-grasp enzyme
VGQPSVAIVTGSILPEPDVDEPLLLAALRSRGVEASVAAWDDDGVDWAAFDLAVVRSSWNYLDDRAAFCAWAERVARVTRLLNPPDVLRWNTDKRYLVELAAREVPVVPTVLVERGTDVALAHLARRHGWDAIVVKPRVSAGSFATRRFDLSSAADEAQRFLAAHLSHRAMMVQPYLASVETSGERAVVWIDGALSHAVRKTPRFFGADEHVSAAAAIAPDERLLAERLLEPFASRLLYGRVDVARDRAGSVVLMELELTEPSLFLAQFPAACERLASAMTRLAVEARASAECAARGPT